MDWTRKVVVVTGAASGIGAATSRLLIELGAKVLLTDVNGAQGEKIAAELGSHAKFMRHDVRSAVEWRSAIALAETSFGNVNALVNNAGIAGSPASVDEVTEDEFRRIFEVNQLSVFLGMKEIVPSMRKAGGGSIVNISSVAGVKAARGAVAYVGTKFAVTGMTKVAALDLAAYNIRVNSVHPGLVDTPMVRSDAAAIDFESIKAFAAGLPIPRPAEPVEIANLIVFLASDAASFLTGGAYMADGGWTT